MTRVLLIALVGLLGLASLAHAIAPGQLDNFESGTTLGWAEGLLSTNPPVNVPDGGPLGPGDNFLRNESSGEFAAPGGKMSMFNTGRWAGNYVAAGINGIQMQVANFGSSDLYIRIAFEGLTTQFGSSSAFVLPADGNWYLASFPLAAGDMTLLGGLASFNAVMTSVNAMRIVSAQSGPSWHGDEIAGILGVDNILALTPAGVGDVALPGARLLANTPNPFSAATSIPYELAQTARVRLMIVDASGRIVRSFGPALVEPAGAHARTWDGRDDRGGAVRPGVYFYRLEVDGAALTRKLTRVQR